MPRSFIGMALQHLRSRANISHLHVTLLQLSIIFFIGKARCRQALSISMYPSGTVWETCVGECACTIKGSYDCLCRIFVVIMAPALSVSRKFISSLILAMGSA